MERATKVVRISILNIGRSVRFLAAPFLLAALSAFANTKADFLIVEEVRPLRIYNQYQQQISIQEKADFLPFSPFRILNADDLLGDGFTPCMRVEFNNTKYFLEKETAGQLVGSEQIKFFRTYRNVSLVGDTVEIVKSNRIMMSDPAQTRKAMLMQGKRVVRIFTHQELTYVKTLGAGSRFGWIRFDDAGIGRDWKVFHAIGVSMVDRLEKAIPQIHRKVNEVNAKLSELYNYFNRESFQRRQPPRWKVEEIAGGVVCVLESDTAPDTFSESTRMLGKTIEGVLLGSGLRVVSTPGRIEIGGGARQ